VRKRLEFLYPGKHELRLNDEGDFFAVALTIYFKAPVSYISENRSLGELKTAIS
jgi:hypothetical protein